jgi:hypothetical protein
MSPLHPAAEPAAAELLHHDEDVLRTLGYKQVRVLGWWRVCAGDISSIAHWMRRGGLSLCALTPTRPQRVGALDQKYL